MKAKNNKTGEIVTSFGFSKEFGTISYIDSKGALTFNTPNNGEWTILDEEGTFDWIFFHAEATKDILCRLLNRYTGDSNNKGFVEQAIGIADELIKQLKEKQYKQVSVWTEEDNKIAKELTRYLPYCDDISKDTKERWISWLEKQGKQKTEIEYIYPKFRIGDVIEPIKPNGYHPPVRVLSIEKKTKSYYCESDDKKSFSSIPIRCEDEYKLVEQKSTWSEDDEKTRLWIVHVLCECGYKFNNNGERENAFELLEKIKQIICNGSLEKQGEREDKEYTDFTIYYPLKNGKGEYECIPYSFYGTLTSFSEGSNLINFLHNCFYSEEECEEWIKKQGEQNQKHFELKAGHWYICHRAYCCRADHLTVKEGERFMCEKDGVVKGFVFKEPEKYFKEVCAPAPMEDEQKTTDNVEPKFKVDDWITNGEYTWKVIDIKPLDYILQSQNGNTVDDTISYVDKEFHLWTIQDAKDGDVLVAFEDGTGIAICGKNDKLGNSILHCYYDDEIGFAINIAIALIYLLHPATKKQRDLLFQKMYEAGYEWDTEKKELCKTN